MKTFFPQKIEHTSVHSLCKQAYFVFLLLPATISALHIPLHCCEMEPRLPAASAQYSKEIRHNQLALRIKRFLETNEQAGMQSRVCRAISAQGQTPCIVVL